MMKRNITYELGDVDSKQLLRRVEVPLGFVKSGYVVSEKQTTLAHICNINKRWSQNAYNVVVQKKVA